MNIIRMLVPDAYVFKGARPAYAVVIHKTASPGMSTAQAVAQYFINGSDGRHVSSHYIIGLDGTIVQCVDESDGAGGNAALPVEPGRSSLFSQAINWNLRTISIEHVDTSTNNTNACTSAQLASSFWLVNDICTRKGIASDHIVEHHDLQPKSKPECAGNYPIDQLRAHVKSHQGGNTGLTVKLNGGGEVADVQSVSQFYPNKTEFACGFFSAALIWGAGKPGGGAIHNDSDIENWALNQYTKEYGSNGANKTGGVSIDDMHRLLLEALPNSGTSHYMDLPVNAGSTHESDVININGALHSGYPVVCTVTEVSIYDTELKANPYFWGASGTHVFVITGIDGNGDYLVHDPANVVGQLQGNNTVRQGPRHYSSALIRTNWASMCRMPWLVPFPTGWNAGTSAPINQNVTTPVPSPIPVPVVNLDDENKYVVERWTHNGTNYEREPRAIFGKWKADLLNDIWHGYPVSDEYKLTYKDGHEYIAQDFSDSIALYPTVKGDNFKWLK